MDDLVTPRSDSSRTAVDPDGKVFKSKPTRRAGRRRNRRRNKKKNQASHDKLSQQQLSESSIAHAQNNSTNRSDENSNDGNNCILPKISTRDASTNTIISATNTSFDDIHPRSIKKSKIHVNNCSRNHWFHSSYMTKLSTFHLVQRHWSKYASTKLLGHQILSVLSDTIPL